MTDAIDSKTVRRAPGRPATVPDRRPVLDDLDRQIIRILQNNARIPNTEIARALKVTETTIRNRVNRLLEEELIEMVALITPKAKEASVSAFILVRVSPEAVDPAIEVLKTRSEVRYLSRVLSRAQILIETFFTDNDHLLAFQDECLAALPGVQSIDTSLVLRVDKASFEWEI
uniref:Transcriptional regulator, AsnC family n=1 Tax=Mycobacterium sp. (strain JLS) TaxID=164757 RepID=A0A5Q5CC60_MYCSJ